MLSDPPPSIDLTDLPGVMWDPRIGALRAPAMHHPALRDALDLRGVRYTDDLGRSTGLVGAWTEPELRPYQDDALWAWQSSAQRGVVVLPTGSGKTRLAVAAMARVRCSALALVPTRVLLEQWLRELTLAFTGPVGCLGDASGASSR